MLSLSGVAGAQYVVSAQAGSIQFVVGNVYLDGQRLHKAPLEFPVLKDQQALRTGRGRAEILLAPGVFLRLGQQSGLRMLDNRLETTVLDVEKGRALVEVVELIKEGHIQIQCSHARVEFRKTGLYRFDADAGELQVFAGEADVAAAGRELSAGRNRKVSLGGTIATATFRRGSVDALYKWATVRSFNLFLANRNPGGVKTASNWVYTNLGWFWNPDYDAQIQGTGSMMKYLPPEREPQ